MTSEKGRRVGVYVDQHYAFLNGAFRMSYEVLHDHAGQSSLVFRGVIYTAYDPLRAVDEPGYFDRFQNFRSRVGENSFEVFAKIPKSKVRKGCTFDEADCDAAISGDMVLDAWRLHLGRVVLISGDGDYAPTVEGLKQQGVFVEVIGFRNVHAQLKRAANCFTSGYAIAGLVLQADPPGRRILCLERQAEVLQEAK